MKQKVFPWQKKLEFRRKRGESGRWFTLRLGTELIQIEEDEVLRDPKLADDLRKLVKLKEENELQFFVPHGTPKMGYDCGFQLAGMVDWLNDNEHTVYMNCSGNQVGKTCHSVVKNVLRLVPTDPSWPIYKTGIKYQEWEGPETLVVLGYDKGQVINVLWPELQKWIPNTELGPYRPYSQSGTREPSWDRHPVLPLKCGSKVIFLTYDQKASVCAGVKAKWMLPDEQMPLTFFNELDERARTRRGVRWTMGFTPHKVEGRPDTGEDGWLRDMWKGINDRGHTIMRCRISIDDVPDHIYSDREKKRAYVKWIELPKKTNDKESQREGEARYYGLFQRASALFYPEVDPDVHIVDWTYDDIKGKGWTHYRSLDYGYSNPTSCGLWAVSPTREYFRYGEYYVAGRDAVEHAPAIIAACGNERVKTGHVEDKEAGISYDTWKEVPKRQKYIKTWLDWHCFGNSGGVGKPIAFFFGIGGLQVTPSTKLMQEQRSANLRALLRIDPNRKHMVTGKLGAPRIYISRSCHKWIWEWERCVFDTRRYGEASHNQKETKRDLNDHAIDETEYFACAAPNYLGDTDDEGEADVKPISNQAGY
jgi:hypothetical protein